MRLTPAQIGVALICGNRLPVEEARPLAERIRTGRQMLSEIAGVDFGYDLQRWHDHLKVSRQGGYTWNRTIALPKVMRAAIQSEEWQAAVRELQATPHAGGRRV